MADSESPSPLNLRQAMPTDPRIEGCRTDALQSQLDASISRGPGLILWDLVGSCNLKCPSCPVGTMPGTNPKGLISDDLFDRILDKLACEFPKWQLHFYNWTEPLIHPRINQFCKSAADRGFHLHLSSNLNYLKDAARLLSAGAKTIRISLSGFTQPIYERGHRGGNIEKVKRHMRVLSEAKAATGSRTRIHVYYHKYRHNLGELEAMRSYAQELGFEFVADWAFLMPLEKLMAHEQGNLPSHEQQFADESIVPRVHDALALMKPHRSESCSLIDQLVLDFQGNVSLCCAVYDGAAHMIGPYLELDWQRLQRAKYQHARCAECTSMGAHVLYTHFANTDLKSEMESLAARQLEGAPARASIRLPILSHVALRESA